MTTIINRQNYEEFFLLHADGELSDAEMQSVNNFIEQNPDLKEELDILLQSKLKADEHLIFEDKTLLYKSESSIHLGNYEEQFLLLIDDELSEASKKDAARFIQQNPQLQSNFNTLLSVKLPEEKIVFIDKQSLYKKEEKRVVGMRWSKLAVAAVLIGIAVIIWAIIPSKKANNIFTANRDTKKEIANPNSGSVPKQETTNTIVTEKNNIASTENIIIPKTKTSLAVITKNIEPKEIDIPSNKEQKEIPVQNTVAAIKNNTDAVKPTNYTPEPVVYKTLVTADDTEQKPVFKQTVYKELNTDADNEKSSIYLGSVEVNKDKLRGLLKRAKGMFNKAKNDDANVAIASFAVSKSLK
jgi:hypothetical protein